MSRRRKPSAKEISAMLNEAVPPRMEEPPQPAAEQTVKTTRDATHSTPPALEEPPEIGWRKSTIPFREDQHREIGRLLSRLHHDLDVQLTIAEVVRLGLDKMIEALSDESARDRALWELYEQQNRESRGNENLKHSRSRGLKGYLVRQSFTGK